jgi:hypothetical protein
MMIIDEDNCKLIASCATSKLMYVARAESNRLIRRQACPCCVRVYLYVVRVPSPCARVIQLACRICETVTFFKVGGEVTIHRPIK